MAAGELPPVEESLPDKPLVAQPWEAIGTYGGRLRLAGSETSVDIENLNRTDTVAFNMEGTALVNDAIKDHSISTDGTTVTLELRKGHKWSDGAPFTAGNFQWHYENDMLSEELSPAGPGPRINGHPPTVRTPDLWTVEISYPEPAPTLLDYLGRGGGDGRFYVPSHYREVYHADFSLVVEKLMRDHGFETWTQLYQAKKRWGANGAWFNEHAVNRPVLAPWTLTAVSKNRASLDRNPYYHVVDTEGNQLPYVDGLEYEQIWDPEEYETSITHGYVDFGQYELDMQQAPLYRDNEASGNYRMLFSKSLQSSVLAFQPNWTYKDEAVAEIFREVNFRIALSVAIDRIALSDAAYFGLAMPFQGTVPPTYTFYEDHWGTSHTEYDPDKANVLLDELNLHRRDAEGWRLRPDGERLTLVMEVGDKRIPNDAIAELVAENWRAVGLDSQWRQMDRQQYEERLDLHTEIMIGAQPVDASAYFTRWEPWVWAITASGPSGQGVGPSGSPATATRAPSRRRDQGECRCEVPLAQGGSGHTRV